MLSECDSYIIYVYNCVNMQGNKKTSQKLHQRLGMNKFIDLRGWEQTNSLDQGYTIKSLSEVKLRRKQSWEYMYIYKLQQAYSPCLRNSWTSWKHQMNQLAIYSRRILYDYVHKMCAYYKQKGKPYMYTLHIVSSLLKL